MNGWICLHKKITEHWIWQDAERFRAWIWILMKANFKSNELISKGQLVRLAPGQFVTSIVEMQEEFGWSRGKVYRFLCMLEREQMIRRNGTPNGTTITVVNWEFYQDNRNANRTPNGTPNETPNGTPNGTLITNITNINKGNKETPASSESEMEKLRRELKEMYGEDA